nr:uncharacterized protein LOC120363205 [Saimiri boliviensis boliviensis]
MGWAGRASSQKKAETQVNKGSRAGGTGGDKRGGRAGEVTMARPGRARPALQSAGPQPSPAAPGESGLQPKIPHPEPQPRPPHRVMRRIAKEAQVTPDRGGVFFGGRRSRAGCFSTGLSWGSLETPYKDFPRTVPLARVEAPLQLTSQDSPPIPRHTHKPSFCCDTSPGREPPQPVSFRDKDRPGLEAGCWQHAPGPPDMRPRAPLS